MKLSDIKVGQNVTLRKGKDATVYSVEGFSGVMVCIKEIGNKNYTPQMVDYSLIEKVVK